MTTLWIVAANAATATLLECTSRQHITEIARLEHPESRLHSRDLESDIPTHGAADRSGLAQRSSAQEREQEHFAQQIASQLKQGLDDHRYGGVVTGCEVYSVIAAMNWRCNDCAGALLATASRR